MIPRSESKDNFLAFTLTRREDGRLDLLDARGQTHHGVEVVRAFPLPTLQDLWLLCLTMARNLSG